jgi:uncharacterized membrane protein YdfJ with MMPL/SSD domain
VKGWGAALGAIAVLLIAGFFVRSFGTKGKITAKPTPMPSAAEQLSPDKQPKVSLAFSSDAHFATVTLSNLNADQMEYNLIYEAKIKNSRNQTGVNDSQNVAGKSTYTKKQLLGSESSGKFTYHEDIQNASMELTLRDADGRSIFTATYPFKVTPGQTVSLSASE